MMCEDLAIVCRTDTQTQQRQSRGFEPFHTLDGRRWPELKVISDALHRPSAVITDNIDECDRQAEILLHF